MRETPAASWLFEESHINPRSPFPPREFISARRFGRLIGFAMHRLAWSVGGIKWDAAQGRSDSGRRWHLVSAAGVDPVPGTPPSCGLVGRI